MPTSIKAWPQSRQVMTSWSPLAIRACARPVALALPDPFRDRGALWGIGNGLSPLLAGRFPELGYYTPVFGE